MKDTDQTCPATAVIAAEAVKCAEAEVPLTLTLTEATDLEHIIQSAIAKAIKENDEPSEITDIIAATIRRRLERLAEDFPRITWRPILQDEAKAIEQVIKQWPRAAHSSPAEVRASERIAALSQRPTPGTEGKRA